MIGRADPLDNSRLDSAARDWSADAALPVNARLVRTSRVGTASGSGLRTRRGCPKITYIRRNLKSIQQLSDVLPVVRRPRNDFLDPGIHFLDPVNERVDPVTESLDPVAEPVDPVNEPVAPLAEPVAPVAESVECVAESVNLTDEVLAPADASLAPTNRFPASGIASPNRASERLTRAATWPVKARLVRTSRVGTASGSGLATRRGPAGDSNMTENEPAVAKNSGPDWKSLPLASRCLLFAVYLFSGAAAASALITSDSGWQIRTGIFAALQVPAMFVFVRRPDLRSFIPGSLLILFAMIVGMVPGMIVEFFAEKVGADPLLGKVLSVITTALCAAGVFVAAFCRPADTEHPKGDDHVDG